MPIVDRLNASMVKQKKPAQLLEPFSHSEKTQDQENLARKGQQTRKDNKQKDNKPEKDNNQKRNKTRPKPPFHVCFRQREHRP